MGVVVDTRRHTRIQDMSVSLAGKTKFLYRYIIPNNQLGVLAQLYPSMKVLEIKGQGVATKKGPPPIPTKFGIVRMSGASGAYLLDWIYDSSTGPVLLSEIYDDCKSNGFGDVSLSWLIQLKSFNNTKNYALEDSEKLPKQLRLVFTSETVHPSSYAKVMIEGKMPMEQVYQMLRTFRKRVDVPQEMKASLRPSFLKLIGFLPPQGNQIATNIWAMQAIQEPGGIILEEIIQRAGIKDMRVAS